MYKTMYARISGKNEPKADASEASHNKTAPARCSTARIFCAEKN